MTSKEIRNEGGFTLLEVLVAFVIGAFGIMAMLHALSQNTQNSTLSQDYTAATVLAESVLVRLGREHPLTVGQQSGRFEKYQWQQVTRPYRTTVANSATIPYEVIVTVRWQTGRRSRAVELRSLRLARST